MFKHALTVLSLLIFLAPCVVHAAPSEEDNAKLRESIEAITKKVEAMEAEYEQLKGVLELQKQQIAALIAEKRKSPDEDAAPAEGDGKKPEKAVYRWNIDAQPITYTANVRNAVGDVSNVTLTYQDRLRAFGVFTNQSKEPVQYSMKIMIYKRLSFPAANPPVLGSASYTTPLLQPGESANISQVVSVSSINDNRLVRIVDVTPLPPKK